MVHGKILHIQRFAVNDGPGIRTTVFFKGCPLACTWCHNPESQNIEAELLYFENRCIQCGDCAKLCSHGAIRLNDHISTDAQRCIVCGRCCKECVANAREIAGSKMTVENVMWTINKDAAFYRQSGGGVTFSGGEPLMQADFLTALLAQCRNNGIHSAVDTCGYAPWSQLKKASRYADIFLYDLKIMDDERHMKFTGVSNTIILDNLIRLSHIKAAIHIRIPIIPGITDDDDNLNSIIDYILKLPTAVQSVELLPFHNIAVNKYNRLGKKNVFETTARPTKEKLTAVCNALTSANITVSMGG